MHTTIRARFARKPYALDEVLHNSDPSATPESITIECRKELTTAEYDAFANTLLDDRDWLAGRGGHSNGQRSVVEVSAPGPHHAVRRSIRLQLRAIRRSRRGNTRRLTNHRIKKSPATRRVVSYGGRMQKARTSAWLFHPEARSYGCRHPPPEGEHHDHPPHTRHPER